MDAPSPASLVSTERGMIGGTVGIHLDPGVATGADLRARRDAARTLARLEAWSARLTRFSDGSDLVRLNGWPTEHAPVRPTLAAAIDWGREAQGLSDGIVDIALLDARLAASDPHAPDVLPGSASPASRRWSMERGRRLTHVVRPVGLRFDLDGVAKGWLADRALRRLSAYPSAIVDADGDIAIRIAAGRQFRFGVADPGRPDRNLVDLVLGAGPDAERTFGLATSGTSIHRWVVNGRERHHLIDPRTGQPADTDLVQATILAGSAREAEAIAKSAVILGSAAALARLDRPEIDAAILLTTNGEVLVTPSTIGWLA